MTPPPELVLAAGSTGMTGLLRTRQRVVELSPGTRLGFATDARRWCLGVTGDGCPEGAEITRGRLCPSCEAQDPWRWMHIAHLSDFAPDPRIRKHLMQPHWLYIATFAGGVSKVGTAVEERKHSRIDEQGALFAHWVAHAQDGIEVREWEDQVSQRTFLGQVVRPATKVTGLASPVDLNLIEARHLLALNAAREVLADILPQEPVFEPWPSPRPLTALAQHRLRAYPESLGRGRHGFTLLQCWGPVALVALDGDSSPTEHPVDQEQREKPPAWAVDLSALVGHQITFGDFRTEPPAIQEELF